MQSCPPRTRLPPSMLALPSVVLPLPPITLPSSAVALYLPVIRALVRTPLRQVPQGPHAKGVCSYPACAPQPPTGPFTPPLSLLLPDGEMTASAPLPLAPFLPLLLSRLPRCHLGPRYSPWAFWIKAGFLTGHFFPAFHPGILAYLAYQFATFDAASVDGSPRSGRSCGSRSRRSARALFLPS